MCINYIQQLPYLSFKQRIRTKSFILKSFYSGSFATSLDNAILSRAWPLAAYWGNFPLKFYSHDLAKASPDGSERDWRKFVEIPIKKIGTRQKVALYRGTVYRGSIAVVSRKKWMRRLTRLSGIHWVTEMSQAPTWLDFALSWMIDDLFLTLVFFSF